MPPKKGFPGEISLVHANLQVSLLQDLSGPYCANMHRECLRQEYLAFPQE